MEVVLAYSPTPHDLHLRLSAQYAKALIASLAESRIDTAIFQDDGVAWSELRAHLAEARGKDVCVALYLHGCVNDPSGEQCGERCGEREAGEPCSCAIGQAGGPAVATRSAAVLVGKHVYGATTCNLGIYFGPESVARGARSFLGYRGDFWHVELEDEGTSPFEEIVNSAATDMTAGLSPADVKSRTERRYRRWEAKMWGEDEEPPDWWLAAACLRHNRECLIALE